MPTIQTQTKTKTGRTAGAYMDNARLFLNKSRTLRQKFDLFNDCLNDIREITDKLYRKNENGKFPIPDKETVTRLAEAYRSAREAGLDLLKTAVSKKLGSKTAFYHSVSTVLGFIGTDLRTLENYQKEGTTVSLPDFIASAHTKSINITGIRTGTMGGQMNARIPIRTTMVQDGVKKIVPGMFTQETFNVNDRVSEALNAAAENSIIRDFAGPYASDLRSLAGLLQSVRVIRDKRSGAVTKVELPKSFEETEPYETLDSYWDAYENGSKDEKKEAVKQLNTIINYAEKFQKENGRFMTHVASGIKPKNNLDRRNCAVTAVADLLKKPGLVARAVPMKITRSDKTVKGTFMEFAEGSDMLNLTKNDPLKSVTKISCATEGHNTGGLIAASDMQVLDFICGNVDRHRGNFFYKVGKKGSITGLQGIDNDLSFGLIKDEILTGRENFQYFTNLKKMRFVTKSMADTLHHLSPEMLAASLAGFSLTGEEIDAACHRLELLKKSLDYKYIHHPDAFEHNRSPLSGTNLYVLTDEQIDNLSLNDVAVYGERKDDPRFGENMFGRIIKDMETVDELRRKNPGAFSKNDDRTADIKKADMIEDDQIPDYEHYRRAINAKIDELDKVNHGAFKSSPEFTNVRDYAVYMETAFSNMARSEADPQLFAGRARTMFETLYSLTSMYRDHKLTDGSLEKSETARTRLEAVTALQTMAENYMNRLGGNPTNSEYNKLCAAYRQGAFDRAHDPGEITQAIYRLYNSESNRDYNNPMADAANPDDEIKLSDIIDGIGARGWEKIKNDYVKTAEILVRLTGSLQNDPSFPDSVKNLVQNIENIEFTIDGSSNGLNAMMSLRIKLTEVSDDIAEYLGNADIPENQTKALIGLHELMHLSDQASDQNAAPAFDRKEQLAIRLLSANNVLTKNMLTGPDAHDNYENALNSMKESTGFDFMTAGKNDKALDRLLRKDAADLLASYNKLNAVNPQRPLKDIPAPRVIS